MNTSTMTEAEAQQVLAEVRNRETGARKLKAQGTLRQVRAEIKRKEAKVEELKGEIVRRVELRAFAQSKVASMLAEIEKHNDEKPEFYDVLDDDDPDVRAWNIRTEKLQAKLQKLIAQRDALPADGPMRLVYIQVAHALEALRHTEVNLANQIRGVRPGWQGGISGVR